MIPPDQTIPVSGRAPSGLVREQSGLNWSEPDYDVFLQYRSGLRWGLVHDRFSRDWFTPGLLESLITVHPLIPRE